MPAPTGNTTTYFTDGPGGSIQMNSRVWTDINGLYYVSDGYYFDNTTNTSWYVQSGYAITQYSDPCYVAPTPPPTVYTLYTRCSDSAMYYILGGGRSANAYLIGDTDCLKNDGEFSSPPGGTLIYSVTEVDCLCGEAP
jgi:hypothetical protein